MRKHLLRVYLKKFKVKENISVLKSNTLSKSKISQDKFLVKIPYREKMDKKIEEKKKENQKRKNFNGFKIMEILEKQKIMKI